ncbi:MAG TPA: hypothetical protein VGC30_00010, partial [Dokdonella sp.]
EPALGRLDQIVAAAGDESLRADRGARLGAEHRAPRPPRRVALPLVVLLVLAGVGFAAWKYQDRLRLLLPHTEFNDTLARGQRALDAGRLTGDRDSARELFQAARAQDPDNDVARRGLDAVGRKLLARAADALQRDDLAAARRSLDAARELLGGGSEVDQLEQTLKQNEARGSATAQLLASADAALAAGRVVGTDGAAALYQRVLDGDRDNALAQAGLRKSADALAAQARAALAAGDVAGASARADDIARALPSYPGLPDLLGEIAKARDTARVALEADVARADAQLRAGRLTGNGDSALELYRSVLRQDPANARAKEGLRRIAQAFVVQASAAIDDSNPGGADKLLASAAELAPDLPELRAARASLRDLRGRLSSTSQRAPLSAVQTDQVRRLVAEAARASAAGNLIVPPGDSAYDKYRAALAIDGNDKEALDGIARLPARAKELFAQALSDGAPQRARALLDSVRLVAPDDPSIPAMTERLCNAFLDQADARIGEGRREDAARALNAARELSPNDPRLAPLDARLRAMVEQRPG